MKRTTVRRYGFGPRKVIGVHGWFGDEYTFDSLEGALDPELFECAWPALRGVGQSRSELGEYTMAETAQDVINLGSELEWESFNLIGHSMGGKAALLAAATAPARVERVLALAPVSTRSAEFPREVWRTFDSAATDLDSRRTVISESVAHLAPQFWVDSLAKYAGDRTPPEVMRSYLHSWAQDDVSAEVRGCATPTFAIVGARDPNVTQDAVSAEFRELLTSWDIYEVAGAGHYVLDEAPLEVGRIAASFLAGDAQLSKGHV